MPQSHARSVSRPAGAAWRLALAAALAACGGGGGGDDTSTPAPGASAAIRYDRSIALGAAAPVAIVYEPAVGVAAATVTTASASALLPAGTTPLLAEHTDARFPGVRVACVSGSGDSTNVITAINLGVIAESAAVLLDSRWSAVDAPAAWAAAVAAATPWSGWENCGVKPEGAPSPSSRLMPQAGGGYAEDVYDGNPSTTFNVLRQDVSAAEVAAMLSPAGSLSQNNPLRPLRVTLRAYADGAGHTLFIQTGVPVTGAPAAARGFIALYTPV